jgi:chromosome segregation ATPase
MLLRSVVFAVMLMAASAVNPVEKVIKLLEDLKKEVVADGKKEGEVYEKYACFCKDTTEEKSKSITKGEDKISDLSADITDNTASKEEKEADVKKRKNDHEQMGEELTTTVARCSTANADYEAGNADMTKALESLKKAIKAMSGAKGKIAAAIQAKKGKITAKSFIQLVADAELMKLDPSDPAYKYHSKEINEILAKLQKDFEDEKKDGQDKWDKTSAACQKSKDGLRGKMKDNLDAITKAEGDIEDLAKTIAKDRGDLVKAQELLEEDAAYLKDLTMQCEARANDFDQRASTRNDEITALSQAIKIITNKVKDADADVNRALLQVAPKALSFLQAAPVKPVSSFLARDSLSTSEQALQSRVVSLFRSEGNRLSSVELSALAMRVNAPDHFKEVTSMIQKLIERLLDEEKAEASKKGWCDTELAKAQKDRDHTQQQANSMSAELKQLEAKKEELEIELKELAKEIEEAQDKLKDAAKLRKEDKEENKETLKTANDGLDALNEAILVLKAFYNQRGPRVLLQASPVDDDTSGPGFSGEYKGSEKKSRAIFALLETIVGDFEKTIKETEQAEAKAHADFVELERAAESEIAAKETKTTLDKQDLKSTNNNIDKNLDNLKDTMGLQDDALKMIDSLKPACLDAGGMGYKDRTTKRNEEIKALELAICILTPGKKEGDCKA